MAGITQEQYDRMKARYIASGMWEAVKSEMDAMLAEGLASQQTTNTGGGTNDTTNSTNSGGDGGTATGGTEVRIMKSDGSVVTGIIKDGKTYYMDHNGLPDSRVQNGDYVETVDGTVYKMVNGSGVKQNGSFNEIKTNYDSILNNSGDVDQPNTNPETGNNLGYLFETDSNGNLLIVDAGTSTIVDTITPESIGNNVDTILSGYGINPDDSDLPDWVSVQLEDDPVNDNDNAGEDGYTDDGYVDLSDTTEWINDKNQIGSDEELGLIDPSKIGDATQDEISEILNQISLGSRPDLRSGDELSNLYGITNDRSEIQDILLGAVDAKTNYALAQQGVNEDKFYDDLANVQNTVLDTLGKNKLNAIQSGASKGMLAANELSTILGLEQTAVGGMNQLAADRKLIADQAAMDIEAAIVNALNQANSTGLKMGETAANILNADMVGYGSELNYDSALRGIAGNLEAQRIASAGQLNAAKMNADATIKASSSNVGSTIDSGFYSEMKKMGFSDQEIRAMMMTQMGYKPPKVDDDDDDDENNANQNMNSGSDTPYSDMPGYGSSLYD